MAAVHELARHLIAAGRIAGKRDRLVQDGGYMPAGEVGLDGFGV